MLRQAPGHLVYKQLCKCPCDSCGALNLNTVQLCTATGSLVSPKLVLRS